MRKIFRILVLLVICSVNLVSAQDLSSISTVEVDRLTDEQIKNFWYKAKKEGYNLEQTTLLLKSKGMSLSEVNKLKERIRKVDFMLSFQKKVEKETDTVSKEDALIFGLTGERKSDNEEEVEKKRDSLFGYDFFNNPKITFTPNINIATPVNYQLGPGDVVKIDIWGAAEANYEEKIDKRGNIQVQGIGRINLSGLSFDAATSKIKSYLRKIYSGINASNRSYNKVHVNVSLAEIRTVVINIVGEVKTPGTYSLTALSTVLNALYAAGGPTKEGTFRKISLVRNGERISDFDFYKYLLTGLEKGNLQLQDQDVIIVGPYQSLVTISGEVKRPGFYEVLEGETIKNLLDYCGGFTAVAYRNIIIVERIKGMSRELKEVPFLDIANINVKAGDKIVIQKVVDKFDNRVKIEGAVYQPGSYEFKKGMRIRDVLKKASGVTKEAFLSRALIIRYKNDVDREVIAFSLLDIDSNNVSLLPNDEIYVYSKDELREKQTLSITGAVNEPKEIDFAEGMTVEDLIAMASGLKEGADINNVEISRRSKDGDVKKIGEVYNVSLSEDLAIQSENNIELRPFDIVNVRYLRGYTKQKTVSVEGEVKFPGDYSIKSKNERISSLLERAGGVSPYAYIKGATLIRKRVLNAEEAEKEKLFAELKEKDTTLTKRVIEKKEFRIGINLKEIIDNKAGDFDLILQEGDKLIIPSQKQTVKIQGEVYSPSLVRFIPGKSLKYYIDNAGGFLETAKKKNTYVVYSNGSVDATDSFLFFKKYPKIEPGTTILVPKKEQSKKVSTQEIIGITTGIATLGVLIDRLTNK